MISTAVIQWLAGNWRSILLVVVLGGLGAWGEVMRLERDHARAELSQLQAADEAAREHQKVADAATVKNWSNAATSIAAAHTRDQDTLRRYYEARLAAHPGNAACGLHPAGAPGAAVPTLADAPRSIDDLPRDCLPLAAQCAETTLQLLDLQDYYSELIRGQVF